MALITLVFIAGTAALGGAVFGYFLRWLITLGKKGSMELAIKQALLEAKEGGQKIIDRADHQAQTILGEVKVKEREKELEWKKKETRFLEKDALLDRRQTDIDREAEAVKAELSEAKRLKADLDAEEKSQRQELERLGGLSAEEAHRELLATIQKESSEDLLVRLRKLESQHHETLEARAREILTTTVQRLANSPFQEIVATTVEIPSDDVKGKIIGKEGRNIRTFEKATGVEVIIDDTPGTVTLSSFDPVRRYIAKIALVDLIADGRIQPARIEEMVDKTKERVTALIRERGEQATYEASVFNLDPRIILILGRLHFRTSYGQNVLQHSIEMAHLAGMLAEELGADATVARTAALVHDLGKAVDHEVPGTHVEIGRRILEKFGASPAVIKAMQAHHGEYPYETLESIIVQTADAISGSRPGARRDSLEYYLKRLKELEGLANAFPGIERSYAIQAGREIRIFVRPTDVTDLEARQLAREVAVRIEQELKYPGEIKVTVIRETRIIDYAR